METRPKWESQKTCTWMMQKEQKEICGFCAICVPFMDENEK